MNSDTKTLLDRQIDDLLLDIRGFALVRDMLVARGATREEIDSHSRALARSRARLAELIRGPGSGGSAAAKVGENGEDAPVVRIGGGQAKLGEDVGNVLFDRADGQEELLGDAGVRAAFGHETEHLTLPRAQLRQRPLVLRPCE